MPVRAVGRFLKAVGLEGWRVLRMIVIFFMLVVGTIVGSVIGLLLGATGLGIAVTGLVMLVGGIVEAMGLSVLGAPLNEVPAVAVLAAGPVAMVVGAGLLVLLGRYARSMIGRLRQRIPKKLPKAQAVELSDQYLMQLQ